MITYCVIVLSSHSPSSKVTELKGTFRGQATKICTRNPWVYKLLNAKCVLSRLQHPFLLSERLGVERFYLPFCWNKIFWYCQLWRLWTTGVTLDKFQKSTDFQTLMFNILQVYNWTSLWKHPLRNSLCRANISGTEILSEVTPVSRFTVPK